MAPVRPSPIDRAAFRSTLVTIRTKDGIDVAASVSGMYRRGAAGELDGAVLSPSTNSPGSRLSDVSGIEVVSTVSHELRSPLTSVKGYTSLLLSRWDRLSDQQKQMMIDQINHDADRVTRLISELLDISRLEAGRLVLRRQLVDLPRTDRRRSWRRKRLEFPTLTCETQFPGGLPQSLRRPRQDRASADQPGGELHASTPRPRVCASPGP